MSETLKPLTREELAEQGRRNRENRIRNYPAMETATLRDLFAAFALAGIIAADPEASYSDRVTHAYSYADEMLVQRSKES